uniref:Nucleoside-triphosphatase, cancer-related n=1 Tax=Eptatretus burgeri TaxID=7764 RepID=A0A8C4WWA0_EPTBU
SGAHIAYTTPLPTLTLIQKVCEVLQTSDHPAVGFYTQEVRQAGRRTGFDVVTLAGRRGPLARVSDFSAAHGDFKVGPYIVDVKSFEQLVIPLLLNFGMKLIHVYWRRRFCTLSSAPPLFILNVFLWGFFFIYFFSPQGRGHGMGLVKKKNTQPQQPLKRCPPIALHTHVHNHPLMLKLPKSLNIPITSRYLSNSILNLSTVSADTTISGRPFHASTTL